MGDGASAQRQVIVPPSAKICQPIAPRLHPDPNPRFNLFPRALPVAAGRRICEDGAVSIV